MPLGHAWRRGLSANLFALVVVGSAGLLVNLLVALRWGPAGLGVFAQTLTWFILAAQVATMGVHYAVLQRVAAITDDAGARAIIAAGVGAVRITATTAAAGSFLLAPFIGRLLGSEATGASIRLMSAAVLLHALTKVLAAGLNGRQHMRRFAAVGSARGLGLLAGVLLLSVADAPAAALGLILVASESVAFIVALLSTGRLPIRTPANARRELARYGFRAAPAALAAEANTRIDVAMLGLLSDDRVVGIYALAVTLYEGCFQLAVVLRNQINGPAAAAHARRAPSEIDALHRQLWRPLLIGALALPLVASLLFEPAVGLLGLSEDFVQARLPLLVLLAGIVLTAHLLPFDQLLIVGGLPGLQSRIVLLSVATNLAVNAVAIPRIGAVGAALGTATALIVLVHGVAFSARRRLGVSLGMFAHSTDVAG